MEKERSSVKSNILSALGIVAIVLLSLILISNLTLIIKGTVNSDTPPALFGRTPLVVLSGSMTGEREDSFSEGALIFVKSADTDSLQAGDVIAFYDPSSSNNSIVTHRIDEVTEVDGEKAFYTKGDNNNDRDMLPVKASRVIGVYTFHLNGVGKFALFLQQPLGMLLFIGVPVLAFIIYDLVRRGLSAKKKDEKTAELEAEIERLRALSADTSASKEETSEKEIKH